MKPETRAGRRADYARFFELQTRWNDNDVYGHVNNVVYYAYFDTAINGYLMEEGGLDFEAGEHIGVCVESQCRYLESIAFPDRIEAGLRVRKLGKSSVRYEVGIFRAGADAPCAEGYFVHVFVDRKTRRPAAIPEKIRGALERLLSPATSI